MRHGALALAGLLASGLATAQGPNVGDSVREAQRQAEIIQQQQQERIEREEEAARRRAISREGMDTEQLQPKTQVPDLGSSCRQIDTLAITGAPNLSGSTRKRVTSEFTQRCLGVGEIEQLLAEITKDYIDRGYITARAYLPRQDLSDGSLEILVIEGVVEEIVVEDGDSNSISKANIFPGIEGDLLNLRDFEQGIDQINRLSSNDATLDIQPGDRVGASKVVVRNDPGVPFHVYASSDNYGTKSTGKKQSSITLSADSLLGLNDLLSVTHRRSLPHKSDHHSQSSSVFFSVPVGYTTLSLNASESEYTNRFLAPSGLKLKSNGESERYNLHIDHMLYRGQFTRASASIALTHKQSNNFLDEEFLAISSRKLSILEVGFALDTRVAGGFLNASVGYAQGLEILDALEDPNGLPDSAPRAQFEKYTFGLGYFRPFSVGGLSMDWRSNAQAQKTPDTLYGSEQFLIGGLYSVRGFDDNSISGDDGFYWRNDLSVHLPRFRLLADIVPRAYIAYDTGYVASHSDNIKGGDRLAGTAIGLTARWGDLSIDLLYSHPVTVPDDMQKEADQTWLRVAYSL